MKIVKLYVYIYTISFKTRKGEKERKRESKMREKKRERKKRGGICPSRYRRIVTLTYLQAKSSNSNPSNVHVAKFSLCSIAFSNFVLN